MDYQAQNQLIFTKLFSMLPDGVTYNPHNSCLNLMWTSVRVGESFPQIRLALSVDNTTIGTCEGAGLPKHIYFQV